jgi:hypothetical protein
MSKNSISRLKMPIKNFISGSLSDAGFFSLFLKNDVVKKYKVNPSTRMFRLYNLMDNSVYLVCIITQVFLSPWSRGRQYFED